MDCVRQVYHKEGLKSFYKGLTASWLSVIENGVYFALYEQTKFSIATYRFQKSSNLKSSENFEAFKRDCFSPFDFIVMSATCKLIASVVSYPHEVLKTRLREVDVTGKHLYRNIYDAIVRIWREEGWRSFYMGIEPHLMRTVPNTAITFLVFEYLMNKMMKKNN